jgi:Zn-dependent protease
LRDNLLNIILLIPGILAGLTFHEYAHAVVADRLGDRTPRFQGRLTLNPLTHIDPIGFLMLLIFQFGWAKPVEVNPSAFKNYYKDDLKVSIAGPIANLIVAVFSAILLVLFSKLGSSINMSVAIYEIIFTILVSSVSINCALFVLNLIPIPGFDGFHVLRDLFPKFFYSISEKLYRYQFIIMILFLVGAGRYVVGVPASFISSLIFKAVTMF